MVTCTYCDGNNHVESYCLEKKKDKGENSTIKCFYYSGSNHVESHCLKVNDDMMVKDKVVHNVTGPSDLSKGKDSTVGIHCARCTT